MSEQNGTELYYVIQIIMSLFARWELWVFGKQICKDDVIISQSL